MRTRCVFALAAGLACMAVLAADAAAMYHPTLGRWTARDPIGYKDGPEFYQYATSGPVAASDPSGLAASRWPEPDRTREGAFYRVDEWTYPDSRPAEYYGRNTLKSCNVVVAIAHASVIEQYRFQKVEELAAVGYLTCWGRRYNWHEDKSASGMSWDEPSPGAIEGFPNITGVVGKGGQASDRTWNAGEGGGLAGWSAVYHAAVAAAKAQAMKFAEDCKCKCDYIDVWVVQWGDTSFTGGHAGRGVISSVRCKMNAKSGTAEPADESPAARSARQEKEMKEHQAGLKEETKNDPVVGGPWRDDPPQLGKPQQ